MYEIRPMRNDDIPDVYAIEKENFSDPWPESLYYSILNDSLYSKYFVLTEGSTIIGFIGLFFTGEEAEIHNICISKKRHGQGFGKEMLNFGIELCRENHVKELFLEVRRYNFKALGLYEKFGFKKRRIIEAYYKQPTEDGILMSLELERRKNV